MVKRMRRSLIQVGVEEPHSRGRLCHRPGRLHADSRGRLNTAIEARRTASAEARNFWASRRWPEGRLHMLDYDKKFLVKSYDNLTFDGSSIRGFTAQRESDLRLTIDWSAFYWAPADFFGPGKVLVFSEVTDKGGTPYSADIRGILKQFADRMHKENGYTLNAANEIEGFIFSGIDAEQRYHETGEFEYVNTGGYYHSLPGDPLRA